MVDFGRDWPDPDLGIAISLHQRPMRDHLIIWSRHLSAIASRPRASDRGGCKNMLPSENHMWRKRSRRLKARMWSDEGPIESRQHER
jgi:hypothetical protein